METQAEEFKIEKTPIQKFKESPLRKAEPMETKGLINNCFFLYTNKIINKGKKKQFDFDDLYNIKELLSYDYNFPRIKKLIEERSKKEKHKNFWLLLIDHFRYPLFLLSDFLMAFAYIMQIPFPFLIKIYLDWLQDENASMQTGWILTGICIFFSVLGRPILFHQGLARKYYASTQSEVCIQVIYCFF